VISVILCTHNPRDDYLTRTLAALRAQTISLDVWELIVVDNLSAVPVAGRVDLSWRPGARVLREETLGLTPARLRGIREAQGDLLVFVDDDNVLDPDYLEQAATFADERPHIGAWSGQCIGEFEAIPPDWTRRYWGNLCIREFDAEVWSNLPRLPETMPGGAGLCMRRAVGQHYLTLHEGGARSFQFDRAGGSLLSGGDNDLAACACDIGLGVALTPRLMLKHLIPPNRLTADYLARLAEGIMMSAILLDDVRGLTSPPRGWIGKAADALRLIRLNEPHRAIVRAGLRGRDKALDLIQARHSHPSS
jgi:hypothetical protein